MYFFSFPPADAFFSRLVSRRLPVSVVLDGVRWKPPAGVRFNRLSAAGARGRGWIGLDGHIYFSELLFSSDFLRVLPSLPLGGFDPGQKAVRFEKALFSLENTPSGQRLRILSMKSDVIEIRGSVCWERGHLGKASLACLLPAGLAERLPENLRRRLSSASGGKKILKCAYKSNQLTFYGASGPLLRAAWSPD